MTIDKIKTFFKKIKKVLTTITNTIFLTIIYVFGIGFTWLLCKIMGKKFFKLKKTDDKTYWTDMDTNHYQIDEYYKQF